MNKEILGVIPARGGSKGIERKNIKQLGGKPLIQHIFETAKASRYITRLILSTEDEEIASIASGLDMEVPFKRPAELSTDTATGISVIKHAMEYFDQRGQRFDGVISLQPTNPFTKAETIDNAICLWSETGCDSVTSIAEVQTGHPYITKRIKTGNVIEAFCPIPKNVPMKMRQDRETAYYLTGALYLRTRHLIEAEEMDSHYLGSDSRAVTVDEIEAIDINTSLDFEFAQWMMSKKV